MLASKFEANSELRCVSSRTSGPSILLPTARLFPIHEGCPCVKAPRRHSWLAAAARGARRRRPTVESKKLEKRLFGKSAENVIGSPAQNRESRQDFRRRLGDMAPHRLSRGLTVRGTRRAAGLREGCRSKRPALRGQSAASPRQAHHHGLVLAKCNLTVRTPWRPTLIGGVPVAVPLVYGRRVNCSTPGRAFRRFDHLTPQATARFRGLGRCKLVISG
jgi:hypothetical protein